MPDFKKMVRDRLRDCGLSPMRECEIVDEISQHLRDRYEALLSNGANEDAAEREIIEDFQCALRVSQHELYVFSFPLVRI